MCVSSIAHSAISDVMSFQGVLKDANGKIGVKNESMWIPHH